MSDEILIMSILLLIMQEKKDKKNIPLLFALIYILSSSGS